MRAHTFVWALLIGLCASAVQFVAVPFSMSSALLAESIHALADSLVLLPAVLASKHALHGSDASWSSEREHRLASFMSKVMIYSGGLAIALGVAHIFIDDLELHGSAGVGPALFGLSANALQFLLLGWCGRCRLHNLSKSHLLIDSLSSVVVSVELTFGLNEAWGWPVDAVAGIGLGLLLVRAGLRGGHRHTH